MIGRRRAEPEPSVVGILGEASDYRARLDLALGAVGRLTGRPDTYLYLADPGGRRFHLEHTKARPAADPTRAAPGPMEQTMEGGAEWSVPTPPFEIALSEADEQPRTVTSPVGRLWSLPLRGPDGGLIGLVQAGPVQEDAVPGAVRERFGRISADLAVVIAQSRREEELRSRLAAATAQVEASRRLAGSAVDVERLVSLLLDLALSSTRTEAGFVRSPPRTPAPSPCGRPPGCPRTSPTRWTCRRAAGCSTGRPPTAAPCSCATSRPPSGWHPLAAGGAAPGRERRAARGLLAGELRRGRDLRRAKPRAARDVRGADPADAPQRPPLRELHRALPRDGPGPRPRARRAAVRDPGAPRARQPRGGHRRPRGRARRRRGRRGPRRRPHPRRRPRRLGRGGVGDRRRAPDHRREPRRPPPAAPVGRRRGRRPPRVVRRLGVPQRPLGRGDRARGSRPRRRRVPGGDGHARHDPPGPHHRPARRRAGGPQRQPVRPARGRRGRAPAQPRRPPLPQAAGA